MQAAGFKDLDCDELIGAKCRDNAGVHREGAQARISESDAGQADALKNADIL